MSTISSQSSGNLQDVLYVLNGNDKTKKQSTTKSFRLDHDILNRIEQHASNNKTSLNAEINSILRKYVEWDMLASKVGMIPITRPILLEVFQNIMTKEQVIELAEKVAKNVISETVHFMKGRLTLESFLSWLRARMDHCSKVNYSFENTSSGPQVRIIFKHDLGENWSVYNKIILDYIFYELGEYTVGIEATPTTLLLYFR